jgi:FkbM family methyltransferase
MVEPVPYVFERLRRHHGSNGRLRLVNAAIADHEGTQELWFLPEAEPGADLPYWYDGLGTLRRDVLLKHTGAIPDVEQRMVRLEVPCLTFDSLCARFGIERLDLVHIDTEGYDFEVVKLIDLDRLRPRLVMFENYHMDPDLHETCLAYLGRHGYEHLADGMDTVCLRTVDLTAGDRRLHRFWRELSDGYVPDSWGPATLRGWREGERERPPGPAV